MSKDNMHKFPTHFDPVPAHRHPNGGGWVADSAHVDDTALVDETSCVYGKARVTGDARLRGNTQVWGRVKIHDARILSSQVDDNAEISGNVHIEKSIIGWFANISGNARVSRSSVYGSAKVYGNANVDKSFISGNAIVCGNANIIAGVLDDDNICTFSATVLQGFEFPVTMTDKHIRIGCQNRRPKSWKKVYKRFAINHESIRDEDIDKSLKVILAIWKIHKKNKNRN